MISKWLRLAALIVGSLSMLSACGYQGYTRYECQEFENWQNPECNPPQCEAVGICTKDLFPEGHFNEVTP